MPQARDSVQFFIRAETWSTGQNLEHGLAHNGQASLPRHGQKLSLGLCSHCRAPLGWPTGQATLVRGESGTERTPVRGSMHAVVTRRGRRCLSSGKNTSASSRTDPQWHRTHVGQSLRHKLAPMEGRGVAHCERWWRNDDGRW
jgi:hypothetical protein